MLLFVSLISIFLLNFGSFEIPKRAIINGKATSYKPFYIGVTTDQLQGSVCGGTFISTKYVLTAAHCLIKGGYRSTGVKVVFQKYHKPHHYGSGKKYNVKQFWTHSDYTEKGHSNDIALIKLKSKSYVSKKKVLAMCKKSYYKDKAASLYVVGMGVTQGNSNYFPKQLQKIRLKETQGNCYFKSIFNPKKQVCTKPTDKYQTQATCQGDSGGPLYVVKKKKARCLYGVVSYGAQGCRPSSGQVFARVSAYRSWVKSKM